LLLLLAAKIAEVGRNVADGTVMSNWSSRASLLSSSIFRGELLGNDEDVEDEKNGVGQNSRKLEEAEERQSFQAQTGRTAQEGDPSPSKSRTPSHSPVRRKKSRFKKPLDFNGNRLSFTVNIRRHAAKAPITLHPVRFGT